MTSILIPWTCPYCGRHLKGVDAELPVHCPCGCQATAQGIVISPPPKSTVESTTNQFGAGTQQGFAGGPGTELKKFFQSFGVSPTRTCRCQKLANKMDRKGALWCLEHIEEIAEQIQEEAEKRRYAWIFARRGAPAAVRLAVKRGGRNSVNVITQSDSDLVPSFLKWGIRVQVLLDNDSEEVKNKLILRSWIVHTKIRDMPGLYGSIFVADEFSLNRYKRDIKKFKCKTINLDKESYKTKKEWKAHIHSLRVL